MTKLSELKQEFENLTGYKPIKVSVLLYLQDNKLLGVGHPLESKTLAAKTTWEELICLAKHLKAAKDKQAEPEVQSEPEPKEEGLEKNGENTSSLATNNPALQVIPLAEKEQKHDRVMSRQNSVLETVEDVEIEPPPPKKKGRKVAPRIKSYAINGHQSNDFLFNAATYKLQIIGNNVALLRYANNHWRMNIILGTVTELKYEKDYWYVLANGTPLARRLANELYHNPGASRDRLAKEFGVAFKTFDVTEGLVEYVQPSELDDDWERKVVTLKRVNKVRTEYQFYPSDDVYQKSRLHKTAIEKTEQWLRHLNTNELTGLPVRFKFRKKRRNGTYKYVPITEEIVNVHKTLQMLVEGRRGKVDMGYYLVKADMSDWTDDELKQMAHQIAITGERTKNGYLKCFTWSGCVNSEQLIWRVLEGCHKLLPPLAFVDDNGDKIVWSDTIKQLAGWLELAKVSMPEYVKWTFDTDTINQFAHWLQLKATEGQISHEYRFKVVSLHQKCPAALLQYYGDVKIKDFLNLAR